jgi:hypothetical protein
VSVHVSRRVAYRTREEGEVVTKGRAFLTLFYKMEAVGRGAFEDFAVMNAEKSPVRLRTLKRYFSKPSQTLIVLT